VGGICFLCCQDRGKEEAGPSECRCPTSRLQEEQPTDSQLRFPPPLTPQIPSRRDTAFPLLVRKVSYRKANCHHQHKVQNVYSHSTAVGTPVIVKQISMFLCKQRKVIWSAIENCLWRTSASKSYCFFEIHSRDCVNLIQQTKLQSRQQP